MNEKLIVKIRIKPINPIITSKIEEQNNPSIQLTLSDKDFDYLDICGDFHVHPGMFSPVWKHPYKKNPAGKVTFVRLLSPDK